MRTRALLVVAAMLAVLLSGVWALVTGAPVAAGTGPLRLDGGLVQVDAVVSAARARHAMPGMGTDNDPVPDGKRRISVDVTVQATGDRPLEYAVDRFTLAVTGGGAQQPHKAVLPGSALPAGTQLSGTLVFDVPVDATTGLLAYDGGAPVAVALPAEAGGPLPAHGAGSTEHSGAGHGGTPATPLMRNDK